MKQQLYHGGSTLSAHTTSVHKGSLLLATALPRGDLLFFCNPNNPTGRLYSCEYMGELSCAYESVGATLVIDESFYFIAMHSKQTSTELCGALLQRGIMVRNCNTYPLLGERYIRIAVRKRTENQRLVVALAEVGYATAGS